MVRVGGHPCLVPDVRGKAFSFSPLNMKLVGGSLCMVFIMVRHVPFILDCEFLS